MSLSMGSTVLAELPQQMQVILSVGTLVLIVNSLIQLIRDFPRRSPRADEPHRIPNLALALGLGWIALAVWALMQMRNLAPAVDPEAAKVLTASQVWANCLEGLVVTLALMAAMVGADPHEFASVRSETPPGPDDDIPAPPLSPLQRWVGEDWRDQLVIGFRVGLVTLIPCAIVGMLIHSNRTQDDTHVLLRTLQSSGTNLLLPTVLAAVVLAPLKEELIFRVILQGSLTNLIGRASIPLVAGLFAAIHGGFDAIQLIPLALIFGALYAWRRNYLEVVTAHATFNGVNILLTMVVPAP